MRWRFSVLIAPFLVLGFTPQLLANGGGASPGYTGAPGESNCTACHSGSAISNSSSVVINTSAIPASGYKPGTTYQLRVRITSSQPRAGFQLVALRIANNTNAGTLTSGSDTEIVSGSGKTYINQSSTATIPTGSGYKEWLFNWRAPSAGTGSVRFYTAVNAAGGTTGTSGDQIHLKNALISEEPPPAISILTGNHTFNAQSGGSNPPLQTLSLRNSGGGTLSWNASDNSSWISLSPTSGSSTGETDNVQVSINTSGLATGTYNGTISISASGASNTPQTRTVTLNLSEGQPIIDIATGNHTFNAQIAGGNPPAQTLSLRNSGGGTLNWNVSDNQSWLSLSPTSGSSTGETDNVQVSVNASGLSQGTYNGTITVSASDATNSPQTRSVTLNLAEAAPSLFTKITAGPVVNDDAYSIGCSWADYDNDGDEDLFVVNANQVNRLYRNDKGSFTRVILDSIGTDIQSWESSTWGDYDNDGDLDVFVTNIGRNALYHNNGNGTFIDAFALGFLSDTANSYGASWVDYDNDGFLDLFVANRGDERNSLYRGLSGKDFTRITSGSIVTDGGDSYTSSWADIDNDGNVDLYVGNAGKERDFLYRNDGRSFSRVTNSPIEGPLLDSFGASWGDYDNDGDFDLYIPSFGNNLLFQNDGKGTFTRVTSGPHVTDGTNSRGSAWGDVDNDGDLDLFVANRGTNNMLFYNKAGSFTLETAGFIVNDGGTSFGTAFADYDNDGNLDLFVANRDEKNLLYRNNGAGNNWLEIKCVGTVSNRTGIGARIAVQADIGNQTVSQLRQVAGETGHAGQNSLIQHFGLGNATLVSRIVVSWPSGKRQTLTDIAVNQLLTVLEPGEPPSANFSANVLNGIAPLSVDFTDLSTPGTFPITGWAWDFDNDGQTDSNEKNPTYVYVSPGTFTVKLTVSDGSLSDTETKASYITVVAQLPKAEFTSDVQIGNAPLAVKFADLSTPGTFPIKGWMWDFDNDGNPDSDQQNPTYTYPQPGDYSVKLTISDGSLSDTITKTNFITVLAVPPMADFTSDVTKGDVPLTVKFTDQSQNGTFDITSWAWDFDNDGTTDSEQQNPTYTYTQQGVFSVKLTVSDGSVADTEVKANFITATGMAPTAAFAADPKSGDAPLTVQFTDQSQSGSQAITSWQWDFDNDGTTDSDEQNPRHTYEQPGIFTVKLTVSDSSFSSTQTEIDLISVNATPPSPDFSATPTSGQIPLSVQFIDQSQAGSQPILSWRWDFEGDGVFDSQLQNPSFTYTQAGSYTVALEVSDGVFLDTLTMVSLIEATDSRVQVWPGDTNNDGVVNQTDVLPIGMFWHMEGDARPNASFMWAGQPVEPWPQAAATFADASGDGIINQTDIIPVGLNWQNTANVNAAMAMPLLRTSQSAGLILRVADHRPGKSVVLELSSENINDFVGIAFEISYSDHLLLKPLQMQPGTLFSDPLHFYRADTLSGKLHVALASKGARTAEMTSDNVARMAFEVRAKNKVASNVYFELVNVVLSDSQGELLAVPTSASAMVEIAALPEQFVLRRNYPNPFNPETKIEYDLPEESDVAFSIFNMKGELVRELVHARQAAGSHSVTWDARDSAGRSVASGIYVYKLTAGAFRQSHKMLLVR